MKIFNLTLWAVILTMFAAPLTLAHADDDDNGVIYSDHSEPEMIKAVATARETLPKFWEIYDSGDRSYSDFSIKVGLVTTDDSYEHIWVNDVKNKNGKMSGKLANDPVNIPDLKFGDKVNFTVDEVTDWAYIRGGRLHGHHTTRVLMKTMDPEMAAYMKTLLSENP